MESGITVCALTGLNEKQQMIIDKLSSLPKALSNIYKMYDLISHSSAPPLPLRGKAPPCREPMRGFSFLIYH
jgi:hypothetical protein